MTVQIERALPDVEATPSSGDYFAEFRHLENSKLENHRLTLRVLKAAEKCISEKCLQNSADNYYLALWPLLFNVPKAAEKLESDTSKDTEWVSTILGLVSRCIRDVSMTSERYSELYAGLSQVDMELSPSSARAAIICAAETLKKTLVSSEFLGRHQESMVDLFRKSLLAASVDARPKVRKQSHNSIFSILGCLTSSMKDDIIQLIITAMHESSRRDCQSALHLLPFLKRALPYLGASDDREKELLTALDYCMTLGNTNLSCVCFDVLDMICLSHPCGSEPTRFIYNLLVKYQPKFDVLELFVPWLLTFAQSVAQFGDRAAIIYGLDVVFQGVQSDCSEILIAGKTAVQTILSQNGLNLLEGDYDKIAASLNMRINVKRFDSFHPAILDICLLTFEAFQLQLLPAFSSTIQLLAILHDRKGFRMQQIVEKILHCVCRFVGVSALIDLVPLRLADNSATKNGWMVGVISKGCFNDSLAVFRDRLVPSAKLLAERADLARSEGREAEGKILETIATQILASFSAFLLYPTDFDAVFDDDFAALCAGWMNSNTVLRPIFCNAFSDFVSSMQGFEIECAEKSTIFPRGFSSEQSVKYLEIFKSQLAPKFLPVLFNNCLSSPSDQRSFVLKCIQAMLSCSSPTVSIDYLNQLTQRLAMISDAEQVSALLDIAGTFILSSVPFQEYSALLEVAKTGMYSSDGHIQKRSYRIISMVGQREDFVTHLLSDKALLEGIIKNAVTCDPSARKLRFKALSLLNISQMEASVVESLVPSILPEVIMGTKDANNRTRQSAFDLIAQWGRSFRLGGRLHQYIQMVMAGLAATTPTMMSGSLLALARLVFEFGSDAESDDTMKKLFGVLLDDAIVVLSSPTKEVVKAAIGFVKVCILALGKTCIEDRLGSIVPGLLGWSQEHTQHFKLRIRHIMERLIRVFGYGQVMEVCPTEHQKLLANIKLCKDRRTKRKKNWNAKSNDLGHNDDRKQVKPFNEAMFEDISDDFEDEDLATEEDLEMADARDSDIETQLTRKLSLKSSASLASLRSLASFKTIKSRKSSKPTTPAATKDSNSRAIVSFANGTGEEEFKRNKGGKLIINEDDDNNTTESVDAVVTRDVSDADFYKRHPKKKRRSTAGDGDSDEEIDDDRRSMKSPMSMATSRASKISALSSRSSLPGRKFNGVSREAKMERGDTLRPGQRQPYAYVPLARNKGSNKGKSRKTKDNDYFMNKRRK